MNDWNIQSRAAACEACAQPFADRQPFHTLLFDEHAEFLRRMDVCEACWQSQFSDGARERKGFISHWQGIYEAPAAGGGRHPKGHRRDAAAEAHRAKRSALRARRLHPRRHARTQAHAQGEGTDRPRRPARVHLRTAGTGDVFTIADPALRLDQLEEVQRDVAALLEQRLESAAACAAGKSARCQN